MRDDGASKRAGARGPVQMLGLHGYMFLVREMADNPNIPGPVGEEYSACTEHAQQIIASLNKVNHDIGVAKMEMLTTAMDFMRNVHGVPGTHGCVVVCYLCPVVPSL